MKRTKKITFKKADAILCADIHLRESVPVARTDDFYNEQWRKLDWLSNLQKKHDCPVIHSGDLFDFWKPSPALLSKAIDHIPNQFYTVYGNHDLPQHNVELKHKSGVYTLERAGKLGVLEGTHWLQEPVKLHDRVFKVPTCVWHVMTYQGKVPWPGCTASTGIKLLKKYPQFDLMVTGDNHKAFVEHYKGRLLVNPGSLFRMSANQIDFEPRVYLYYANTNEVIPEYVPIKRDVISLEHLETVKERDNRIDAFISTLNDDWKASLSFEQNLELFKLNNEVSKEVWNIIEEAIESGE